MYPQEAYSKPLELIQRTENIALAKVTSAEIINLEEKYKELSDKEMYIRAIETDNFLIRYHFETLETLKGNVSEQFSFDRDILKSNSDFESHTEEAFWEDKTGRASFGTNCKMKVGFAVGDIYLMFLDEPHHHKSFEKVGSLSHINKEDKWLQFVKDRTIHIRQ